MDPTYTWPFGFTQYTGATGWPERPPVPPTADEQRPLKEAAYRRWLETEDGQLAWWWMRDRALIRAHNGARQIGVKGIVERCREVLMVSINNSWTAYIARDLVDGDPERFGPLIKLRALGAGRGRGAALR